MGVGDEVSGDSAVIFGASGGIGRALVERLRASGCFAMVHAGSRDPGPGWGDGVSPFAFDLTDEASIEAAARTLKAPTLVIVATGMLHDGSRGIAPEKSLRAIDPVAMARLIAVNTIGPALIAKHILPLLPRHQRAVFAVLSAKVGSIGDNALGGWHSYRASKAALNMLMRNFAIEMARDRPQAILASLHPGTVDSALSEPFQRNVSPEKLFTPDQAAGKLLAVIEKLTPDASGGLSGTANGYLGSVGEGMAKMRKKADLPTKICPACQRPFTWRKKWARDWEQVVYCSDRCRGSGT